MVTFSEKNRRDGLRRLRTMKMAAQRTFLFANPMIDIYEYKDIDRNECFFAFGVHDANLLVRGLTYYEAENWLLEMGAMNDGR